MSEIVRWNENLIFLKLHRLHDNLILIRCNIMVTLGRWDNFCHYRMIGYFWACLWNLRGLFYFFIMHLGIIVKLLFVNRLNQTPFFIIMSELFKSIGLNGTRILHTMRGTWLIIIFKLLMRGVRFWLRILYIFLIVAVFLKDHFVIIFRKRLRIIWVLSFLELLRFHLCGFY